MRTYKSLLGMLSSAINLVVLAHLKMRQLQEKLQMQCIQATSSFKDLIFVTPIMQEALKWWCHEPHLSQGLTFLPSIPDVIVTTDTSVDG